MVDMMYSNANKALLSIPTNASNPFLGTLLNILSFFYIIPFKLVASKTTGNYVFTRNASRTIIVLSIHGLIMCMNVFRVIGSISEYILVRHDISTTFYLCSQLSNSGAVVALQWIFWLNQDELKQFVKFTTVFSTEDKATRSKTIAIITFTFISASSIALGFITKRTLFDFGLICQLIEHMIAPVVGSTADEFIKMTCPKFSEGRSFFTRVIHSAEYFISNVFVTVMLILSLCFKHVISEHFCQGIRDSYGSVYKLLGVYKAMKDTTTVGGNVFGNFILCYYVATLSFLAMLPQLLLGNSDEIERILMMSYATIMSYTLAIASKAHTQVEKHLKEYIASHHWDEQGETNERLQLIAVTQDMEAEPIALSCCFFAITRKFLSSTLGLFVTYSLIVLQITGQEKAFWETSLEHKR